MKAGTIALSALLLMGALLSSSDSLAHSFGSGHTPGNKLNDKVLLGKAGGRTGIGGTESRIFPTKHPGSTAQASKR